MPFQLTTPQPDGTSLDLTVNVGECVFVLGANGTGKSSLMHRFYKTHQSNSRRISAHRQTWFSNAITLSAAEKRNIETNILSSDASPEARWQDTFPAQRASIAIYDLIDAENVRARSIASAVDNNNYDVANTLSKKDAPIKIINELHCFRTFGS